MLLTEVDAINILSNHSERVKSMEVQNALEKAIEALKTQKRLKDTLTQYEKCFAKGAIRILEGEENI